MFGRALIVKIATMRPIRAFVSSSRLVRPLVGRFIAGEDLSGALDASRKLLDKSLMVSLDYLGENTRSKSEASQAVCTYIEMLDRIGAMPETAARPGQREPLNISIKLTQCGLDQEEAFAEENLRRVLQKAQSHENFVRVDMEGSDYTERTLQMVERVFADLPNTGTVLQSYLYRTDEDVERMIGAGIRIRLVKGAYLEPASVAYPEKAKVDEAYVRQAKRLLEFGNYPAIATQDDQIIREVVDFSKAKAIDASRFEFQMLYGIRRDLQESLVRDGFNVRIYVPFGDAWYPYFTRRLAERPANALFIFRALLKG